MNGYLLDTHVLSELQRPSPAGQVVKWLRRRTHRPLYISVITLGEIRRGIELRPLDQRRLQLERALETIVNSFSGRTLGVDAAVADRWGRLTAKNPNTASRSIDALLAATALERRLVMVTRNVNDFFFEGLDVIDPWR